MNYRVLVVCFSALMSFAPHAIANADSAITLQQQIPEDQLLEFLIKGQYTALNDKLKAIQKTPIADSNAEKDLHRAVYEFYRADSDIGSALNKWVLRQPNEAMPHLARGVYRTKMGWVSRGEKFAIDTSNSQFSGMAAWLNGAKEDLNRAIVLDPSLLEAYCYLIEIDMNEGGHRARALFDQALKIRPSTFIAREFFIHSQLPRWGGSYEAMKQTVFNSRSYYKENPGLKVFEGRVAADLGELATNRKDFKGALKYFDEALANGNFWFYNQKKGELLWEIDDYQGAIDQYSQVILEKPGYKRAWWMRSQSYKMLGNFPKALSDISYTIKIEPRDDLPIAARGYIYQMSGDLTSALKDFRAAAALNPGNQQHQQAISDVLKLIDKPKDSKSK